MYKSVLLDIMDIVKKLIFLILSVEPQLTSDFQQIYGNCFAGSQFPMPTSYKCQKVRAKVMFFLFYRIDEIMASLDGEATLYKG